MQWNRKKGTDMNGEFAQRVRCAAIAAWWTVLIAVLFVVLQWVAYVVILSARPAWVLAMWGPDVTWPTARIIWLCVIAAVKACVWIMALLAIWLSLWARRLRRI
jgi:hypothetical protein